MTTQCFFFRFGFGLGVAVGLGVGVGVGCDVRLGVGAGLAELDGGLGEAGADGEPVGECDLRPGAEDPGRGDLGWPDPGGFAATGSRRLCEGRGPPPARPWPA